MKGELSTNDISFPSTDVSSGLDENLGDEILIDFRTMDRVTPLHSFLVSSFFPNENRNVSFFYLKLFSTNQLFIKALSFKGH